MSPLVRCMLIITFICVLNLSTIFVVGSNRVTDGTVVIQSEPISNVTYWEVGLNSAAMEEAANDNQVSIPSLRILFTNLSTPLGVLSDSFPTIYGSWNNEQPNSTYYDFKFSNGLLNLPGTIVVGQHSLWLTIDLSAYPPTSFSIGASMFEPLPVSICPQYSQLGFATNATTDGTSEDGEMQFTTRTNGVIDMKIILGSIDQTMMVEDGTISMYVSTQPNPTSYDYQWTNQQNANTILISHTDPNYPSDGQFYIGVTSTSSSGTRFLLSVASACSARSINNGQAIALE